MANGDPQQQGFGSFARFGVDPERADQEDELEREPGSFASFVELPEPPGPGEVTPPPDIELTPDEPDEPTTINEAQLARLRRGLGPARFETASGMPQASTDVETDFERQQAAMPPSPTIRPQDTKLPTSDRIERLQRLSHAGDPEARRELLSIPGEERRKAQLEELARRGVPEARDAVASLPEFAGRRMADIAQGASRGVITFGAEMGSGTLRFLDRPLGPLRAAAELAGRVPPEVLEASGQNELAAFARLGRATSEPLREAEEAASVSSGLETLGAPNPEALQQSADFLNERARQAQEVIGRPDTGYGVASELGTRLGLELSSFVAAGGFVRGTAGRASRALSREGPIGNLALDQLGMRTGRVAEGLSRIENPMTFGARVIEDVVSGGAMDYLIAASAEENASATFLRDLSKREDIREGLEARGIDPDGVTEFLDTVVEDDAARGLFEGLLGTVISVPIIGGISKLSRGTSRSARRIATGGPDELPPRTVSEGLDAGIGPRAAEDLDPEQRQLPRMAEAAREQDAQRFRRQREDKNQRARVTLAQLSKGQVEWEDLSLEARRTVTGSRLSRHDMENKFQRLPDELYHVTTARRQVQEQGLKSRRQLDQERGRGLGGGDDLTISFTGSRETAENIAATMQEARRVANGEITLADLRRMAEEGEGADRPYASNTFAGLYTDYTPGEELPESMRLLFQEGRKVQNNVVGMTVEEANSGSTYSGTGWVPLESRRIGNSDSFMAFHKQMDEADLRRERFEVYKRLLAFREEAGGPSNPLFFQSDVDGLAELDPEDIAIVTARPANPNAKGLQMNALDEWRVYSGDAVEIEDVPLPRQDAPRRRSEELGMLERGEEVPALPGSIRRVKAADGTELVSRYEVIESRHLRTSHDAGNFAPRSDYPEGVQERRYHADPAAQERVVNISRELDPEIVLDPTRRPTDGPPIITPDGVAVSGNARGMALQRAYEMEPERAADYRDMLVSRRSEFGVDASESQIRAMDEPVLVRRIVDGEVDLTDRETVAELASKFNDVSTKAREPLAEAATRARRMIDNGDALEFYASNMGPEQTLRDFLRTSDGREWVRRLNDEGTIPDAEFSRFLNREGNVTDEAKTALERMVFAAAVDDAEVLARAPASTLRKLTHAVPPMVKAAQVDGWDLGPTVREALDVLHSYRNADFRTFDEWRSQLSLFDEPQDPRVLDMAEFLNDRNTARIKEAFRGYAADADLFAREETQQTLALAEPAAGPEDAFRRNFDMEPPEAAVTRPVDPGERSVNGVRYKAGVEDASGDEMFGTATAIDEQTGEVIGSAPYSAVPGESIRIGMLEVEEAARRQGVARELIQTLRENFPEARVDPGLSVSDEGAAFVRSLQDEGLFQPLGRGEADVSGTPARASSEGAAGGARRTAETSGNEPEGRTQPPREGAQTSTQDLSPSSLKRAISPSTREIEPSVRSDLAEDVGTVRLGDVVESETGEYRVILQPTGDKDQLLETARRVHDDFRGALERIAEGQGPSRVAGIEIVGTRVKEDGPRLAQKLENRPAWANSDYLGGRVWAEDLDAVRDLFDSLGSYGFRVVEIDNFLLDPKGGYRAIHANLEVPGERGFTAELQVVPREVGEVQDEAHSLYDVIRKPDVPSQQRARLQQQVEDIFEPAWNRWMDRTGLDEDALAQRIGAEPGGAVQVTAGDLRVGDILGDQGGFARPEVLTELSRVGLGGIMGSTVGSFFGDTPEEKQRNALLGFVGGMGGTAAARGVLFGARKAIQAPPSTAVGRVLDKVVKGHSGDTPLQRVQSFADALREGRRRVFDVMHPIERFKSEVDERILHGIPATKDPAMLARAASGWSTHATEVYERGVVRPGTLERLSDKGLKQIVEELGPRLDDFRAYGIARRVLDDLEPRGIETPITPEEARQILDELGDDDVLVQAFDDWQAYNRAWLQLLEDEGLLKRGGAQAIIERPDLPAGQSNQSYFPLLRKVEDQVEGTGGKSFANLPKPIKKIRGDAELDILDPVESMIVQTYSYSNLIFRQRVSRALADLAEAWPDNPYMNRVPRPTERIQFAQDQLRGQIPEELFVELENDAFEAWIPRRLDKDDPVVRVLSPEGETEYYELSRDMMDAALSLNPKQHEWWSKLLSAPARWLRTGVTLMPEFQIRNFLRDLPIAYVTSKTRKPGIRGAAEVLGDTWRAMGHLVGDALGRDGDELVQLWRTTGGPFGAFQHMDRDALQEQLRALSREGTVLENVAHPMDGLRAMGDRLRGATIAVENAPRLGEFMRHLRRDFGSVEEGLSAARRGETSETAIRGGVESKDLTVDFSRHGASTDHIRPWAAFWNARMQGMDKLGRRFWEDPKRMAAAMFGVITLPSIGLYAVNRNDPDYWQIPLWERNFFWMVKLPGNPDDMPDILTQVDDSSLLGQALKPMIARGDDMWLRIPKPHELGWTMGSIPERFLESIDPLNPYRSDQVAETLGNIGGELAQMFQSFIPAPTGVLPWLENWMNYDTFLQRPVVPYFEATTEGDPTLKGRDRATEVGKSIADVLGVSPAQVDNVLNGYFGTAGRAGLDLVDELARPPEDGPSPHKRADDRAFVGAFLSAEDRFDAKSIGDFYDQQRKANDLRLSVRDWLEKAERRLSAKQQLGDELPESAREIAEVRRAESIWNDNTELLLKRDVLNEVSNKMKVYRQLRERIRDAPTVDEETKDRALGIIARNMAFMSSLTVFGPEAREELLAENNPTDQERLWAAQLEQAEAAADTAGVLNVVKENR